MPSPKPPLSAVANISLQFSGDLPQRVARAAEAGFGAVEFWRWEDVDVRALREACVQNGVRVEAFVTDWTIAVADPRARPRFRDAVAGALQAAETLDAPRIVVTLGAIVDGQSASERMSHLADAVAEAAELAAGRDVMLLIEPVNDLVDHPGSALTTTAQALELLDRVDRREVGLLFDAYHSVTQGEDAVAELRRAAPRVAYVQIADAPGRHEPGTGTIAWPEIAAAIHELGYLGPVGFEYTPTRPDVATMVAAREAWERLSTEAGARS
jgi:hydroxypyruvate isomerase